MTMLGAKAGRKLTAGSLAARSEAWLLPTRCVLCRGPAGGPTTRPWCTECERRLDMRPYTLAAGHGPTRCVEDSLPTGLASLTALGTYEGDLPRLVAALKYRGERHVVDHVAQLLAAMWPADRVVDAVCWAPTSQRRRRERGFDQAELIARTVSGGMAVPVVPLLVRVSSAPSQTGRTATQRHDGVAFAVNRRFAGCISGYRVLIVDDVVTTGATMAAAARALSAAGSSIVHGMSIAVTPRKFTVSKQ